MKYYICLEEDRIWYVRGRFKRCHGSGSHRRLEIMDWEFVEPVPDVASALACLAEKHGMEGKRVSLVVGQDVKIMGLTVPKAGKNAMKRMAVNELSMLDAGFGDHAAALDLGAKSGRTMVAVTAYYMEQRSLNAYKKALENGKMICGRVLVLPDCMALMARELWKEERILLVDVGQGGMGFYVLSGGHCLACRMTGLKAGCFIREGAMDLLYEEMAEQVEGLIQECSAAAGVPAPDCMVIMSCCLPDAESAAGYMSQRLKIPCCVRMPEPVDAACLAACVAGSLEGRRKALELEEQVYGDGENSALSHGVFMTRGWALFLLVNGLAAAGLSLHAAWLDRSAGKELARRELAMEGTEYRARFREALQMEAKIGEMSDYSNRSQAVKTLLAGKNLLGMDGFRAFTEAMEPGMRIESITFDGVYLEMVVSMEHAGDVPVYVEKVEHSGVFGQVGHSLWEKREEDRETERVYATVYGSLGTGGQDEAQ
jgi:hypothetical protein